MKMGTTCWSGGRAARFDLDIPSASTTTKPRTPRKRPNQTYNEAASLLSTAYPTVFSAKLLTKPLRFAKPLDSFWDPSPPDLFLPFPAIDHSGFRAKPSFRIDHKPYEIDSRASSNSEPYEEDFDTESILDEEIEEGVIDRIMGISRTAGDCSRGGGENPQFNSWLGLGFGFGVRKGVRPLRQVDGNDRCSPIVDVLQISPRFNESPVDGVEEISIAKARSDGKPLLLKLDYESVVNAWSDRGSPFPEELAGSDGTQCDVSVGPSVRRKSKSKKIASLLKASTK